LNLRALYFHLGIGYGLSNALGEWTMSSVNTSRASTSASSYSDLSSKDMATDVYRAFRGSGFSDAQSQALTAEINRENNFQQKYLFGTHPDRANKATNVGMLSWQGDRVPELMSFMSERGVIDSDGGIIPGREALQAQTDFIRQEMETNPSYKRTRDRFLANPDVAPGEAAQVLGDNYIRWRRTDPEYASSGNDRIEAGYALLRGVGAETLDLDLDVVRPRSRPDTTGGVEAALRLLLDEDGGSEGKDYKSTMSGLSMLGSAFSSPEVKPITSTASVQRGGGGRDALSRFEGLASLGGGGK
tara:strand:- start:624 stop:1526 length:903 start_codon:yes stop_codon:yes gene_type:complete